ncbi:peptidoglycan DD-metalloendopeptidase family protein [Micrococcus lacusdianchii]|uniref:peptidoglycan DD-metalloendopeptidase family protein n=1 Tax=Micrococcus lacusdianchii TaxID=2915940 RepID=UPI0020052319
MALALAAGPAGGPEGPPAAEPVEEAGSRVVVARGAASGPATPLLPPVPGAGPEDILRGFAAPVRPWGSGHRGVDVAAPGGRVTSPAAGTVRFVGAVVGRGVVTIEHPDGTLSSFEPVDSSLVPGQAVAAGQEIGTVAPVLHCPVRCVHWGLRREDAWQVGAARYDRYLDPLVALGWSGPSVLWPQDPSA